MRTVSRFEGHLLYVLRTILRQRGLKGDDPLTPRGKLQAGLGPDALALVRDALAKGCMRYLVEAGGWRHERFLRGERPVEGMLWQRTPPAELGLTFSRHTLGFLLWLAGGQRNDRLIDGKEIDAERTVGDRFLLFLAYEQLRTKAGGEGLARHRLFLRHGVCRLMFPDDFADTPTLDFAPWTTGTGACILEALQRPLAMRWLTIEQHKEHVQGWQAMQTLGRAQEAALNPFLSALEKVGRRDLARFLLLAADELLTPDRGARHWTRGLASQAPRLADRQETSRQALAFLRLLERLGNWEQQARAVGYLDEDYGQAQFWKAEWEQRNGAALLGRAREIVQELLPLTPL